MMLMMCYIYFYQSHYNSAKHHFIWRILTHRQHDSNVSYTLLYKQVLITACESEPAALWYDTARIKFCVSWIFKGTSFAN